MKPLSGGSGAVAALIGSALLLGAVFLTPGTGLWASSAETDQGEAHPVAERAAAAGSTHLDRIETILRDEEAPEADRIARALEAIEQAREQADAWARAEAEDDASRDEARRGHAPPWRDRLVPAPGLRLDRDNARDLLDDPFFGDPGRVLRQHDPLEEMERIREQTERIFDDALRRMQEHPHHGLPMHQRFSPDLDLTEDADAYIVRVDLPGMDKEAISIRVDGRRLTISGERLETVERRAPDGRVLRHERQSGRFQRTMTLPGPVDAEGVSARYEDGVLIIELPKVDQPPADPRKVEVI